MVLNKFLFIGLLVKTFLLNYNCFCQNLDEMIVDEDYVEKCDSVYCSIGNIELGDINYLRFEILEVNNLVNSVEVKFVIWDCTYYSLLNEMGIEPCEKSGRIWDLFTVKTLIEKKAVLNEKFIKGVYKPDLKLRIFGEINTETTIVLSKGITKFVIVYEGFKTQLIELNATGTKQGNN